MGAYQAVESNYDIQYKRWGKEKTAGSGVFGDVRACTHTGTHQLRAVKTIEKTSWSTRSHVMTEIAILKALAGKHRHVIEFVEYYEEWGSLNLIFEYCNKGSLHDAIEQKKSLTSEGGIALFIFQLFDALVCLQENQILHRDVKPANLLLQDESTLKLADFGSACFYSEPLRKPEGTPAFFAPEALQLPRGKGYGYPVDMWATGVTLYMLLFGGAHPFNDRGAVCRQQLCRGEFDVGWLTSSKAQDLLTWLLMPYPEQRISAEEAQRHAWFASHRLGEGTFSKELPSRKLILDTHGNWQKMLY